MNILNWFKHKKTAKVAEEKVEEEASPRPNDIVSFFRDLNNGKRMFGWESAISDHFNVEEAMKMCFPRRTTSFVSAGTTNGGAFAMDADSQTEASNARTMRLAKQAGVPPHDPTKMFKIPAMKNSLHNQNCGGGGGSDPYKPNFDPLQQFGINEKVLKHFMYRGFIDWNACALIAQHEFVSRACLTPAEDAMAHGYQLVCASEEHDRASKEHNAAETTWLKEIKKSSDEMGINQACIYLNYNKKVFGVGYAIPKVEFVDADEDGNPDSGYEKEYDPTKIKPGSYKGMAVVDPQWLSYEFDEESSTDPVSPWFHVPTWYVCSMTGKRYHRSWVIKVLNADVPDILKPTYRFGGLPLTQMIYERVFCADKLANEAPLLAMTKRLLIADGNLEQMMADPSKTNLFFKTINWFRDNFSVFIKKPSAQISQIDTSLADLTPLTMSQYQLVAAIAQIPVTKLLKNVPSGLQATGQYEWDDYAQSLQTIQQTDYLPLLRMHYDLYIHSNYADRQDLAVDIVFNPIDVPKENEVTQMASSQVQFCSNLMNYHICSLAEVRSILMRNPHGVFDGLSPKVPELLQKLEDANDPDKQQGGEGGGLAGLLGGMGGGNQPPQGGEQPQGGGHPQNGHPQSNPNDSVFQNALNKILSKGKEGDNGEETDKGIQGEEGNGKGGEQKETPSQSGGFQGMLNTIKQRMEERKAKATGESESTENEGGEGEEQTEEPAQSNANGNESEAVNGNAEGDEGKEDGVFAKALEKLNKR